LQAFEKDKIRLKTSGLGQYFTGCAWQVQRLIVCTGVSCTTDENMPSTEVAFQGATMGEAEGGV